MKSILIIFYCFIFSPRGGTVVVRTNSTPRNGPPPGLPNGAMLPPPQLEATHYDTIKVSNYYISYLLLISIMKLKVLIIAFILYFLFLNRN